MSVICDTLNERLRRDAQPKASRRPQTKNSSPAASLENLGVSSRYLNGSSASQPSIDTYELSVATSDAVSAAQIRTQGKHVTVLLAEERTIVREGIGALLDAEDGLTVIAQTADCAEALALAEKQQPDVVVISIRLALRHGLESFRRTIEASCGARVLVLVPHHDNNALTEHVAAAGAAASVTEQASGSQLAEAVREASGNQRPADRAGRMVSSSHHGLDGQAGERDITRLTSREREVLQFIAEGNGNKQTASKLCISVKTVEKHRQSIMDKLGIHETATLTRYAMYSGIVQ